ncbi:MAG: nitroreductase/quinone reductase family protein, partial [Nitrososphaerales archaeon]
PDWFHNLMPHPDDVQIEVGDDAIDVRAREIKGPERDRTFTRQSSLSPQFGNYEKRTKRIIPVIELMPKARPEINPESYKP